VWHLNICQKKWKLDKVIIVSGSPSFLCHTFSPSNNLPRAAKAENVFPALFFILSPGSAVLILQSKNMINDMEAAKIQHR